MSTERSPAKRDERGILELIRSHPDPKRVKPRRVFANATRDGGIYRWGLAVAGGGQVTPLHQTLSRVAGTGKLRGTDHQLDWESFAQIACDSYRDDRPRSPSSVSSLESAPSTWQSNDPRWTLDLPDALEAILWAASIGAISRDAQLGSKGARRNTGSLLDDETASEFIMTLLRLHEDALDKALPLSTPLHLMLGGELGLTLAWHFPEIDHREEIVRHSAEAISQWCNLGAESVSTALEAPTFTRMALASLIRCGDVLGHVFDQQLPPSANEVGKELSHWVAAMTMPGGPSAFSNASCAETQSDTSKDGLLDRMTEFDSESLEPAVSSALGTTKTKGRLTWQVNLPESFLACDRSKLVMMLPEWDVRRGKMHIDYSGDHVHVELLTGKTKAIQGKMTTTLRLDDQPQEARGEWEEICRYTDDDVHYIELEQAWTGGLLLQRQFLTVRDDRCVLIADAIVADPKCDPPEGEIEYQCEFPVPDGICVAAEPETREMVLHARRQKEPPYSTSPHSKKSARAVVVPLSASEWRTAPSIAALDQQEVGSDHPAQLTLIASGRDQLYVPLWIDCEKKRLRKQRTWRQLTVADALKICSNSEANAYRIQAGDEHWCVYRSLGEARCRSFLGKHMLANFFVSRFDLTDGSHEDLITVDEDEVT